ncbi:MAG: sodium:solute symporter family protein [Phycisphaerales bacterium]|jgi:SSS family solute:Na+ symporter
MMSILGFHPVDVLLIIAYLAVITYIGKRIFGKIHTEVDFFLAGRSMNKVLQFFLNMGTLSDANTAVRTASFTFNKGLGGVWLMLAHVFAGPYYWFMAGWFRRVRLVTMAELFEERFKSRILPSVYACWGIWLSILIMGVGYKASLRTFQALAIKPDEQCTVQEKQMMQRYQDYRQLEKLYKENQLKPKQLAEYKTLDSMYKKGQINAYVSYIKPAWFYLLYSLFVGMYIIMGGFKAAAVTDTIQGFLIIAFSVMLIPLSLVKLGGWTEFTSRIPEHMLYIFGSGSNEFGVNSITVLVILTIIGITGHQGNMSLNGSAKDELTARIANIGGAYTKRVLTIIWGLCGLFAFALYRHDISDPDMAWGVLSNNLLGVGLRGIMVAGILAANMSTLDAVCVYLSALFVRHLYKPFVKNKSQMHYVGISRLVIAGFLLLAVYVSVTTPSIIYLIKALPSVNVIFGAPVLLLLFWKRLTLKAVWAQVIICSIVFAVLPSVLPAFDSIKHSDWLTQRTHEQTIKRNAPATEQDVENGFASTVGQKIKKEALVPPASIYYDSVARSNPNDPNSRMVGIGRLHTELVIAGMLGFDLRSMTPSWLLTLRYAVPTVLPFLILIPISLVTKNKGLEERIARFYAKMKTPVIADAEKDEAELQKSYENPTRFDHTKLFPRTNWEFCKWTKVDTVGFFVSIGLTTGILTLFWALLKVLA